MKPKERTQERLISALISAPTLEAAAEKAGIGLSTVKRRLKDSEFVAAYRQAQRNLLDRAVNLLAIAAADFAQTLHRVATDLRALPSSQANAAAKGLHAFAKLISISDIEARLSELERSAAILNDRRR
jgi:hypothetical protein